MAETGKAPVPSDPRRSVRSWGPFAVVALAVTAYYELGNFLFYPDFEVAHRHAVELWRWEQALFLDWEPTIQGWFYELQMFGRPVLMDAMALIYVGPHFLLTFGMFAWAYWRHFDRFNEVRNVFAAFTVLAFGFQWLYPVAPPWQTPESGIAYGLTALPVDGSNPVISRLTNPLAALPSVHTGWAFLCAWFLTNLSTSRWRHLWWSYPSLIVVCIIATGNHFIIDILAAAPFLAAAFLVDAWLRRSAPAPFSTAPPANVPAPVHGPADQALLARWQSISRLPARPHKVSPMRNAWAAFRLGQDYFLSVPPRMARTLGSLRRYPAPFRKETVTARDGTRLATWVGLQPGKRPALLIVPGLFTSKDNSVVRRRALHVYRKWGYHVMTLDMRCNGESQRVPSTTGWKEAEDLLDAVRHLRTMAKVDGVAVYAESLAGTAAAVAARLAGERGETFADLGVVAVSALHDPAEAIRLYTDPPPGPLRPFARFFTFLLRRSGQKGVRTFQEYLEASSRHYGVEPDAATRMSTPLLPGMRLSGPVLIVHSHDDDMVPASQVTSRLGIVRQTRGLAVWVLPWGHHCLYELAEKDWFWGVLEGFLGPHGARIRTGLAQRQVDAVVQQA